MCMSTFIMRSDDLIVRNVDAGYRVLLWFSFPDLPRQLPKSGGEIPFQLFNAPNMTASPPASPWMGSD